MDKKRPPIVPERVKIRREQLGIASQAALGRLCGTSAQTIQKIEDGRTRRPTILLELARALQTTAEWLCGSGDIGSPPEVNYGDMHLDVDLLALVIEQVRDFYGENLIEQVTPRQEAEHVIRLYGRALQDRQP